MNYDLRKEMDLQTGDTVKCIKVWGGTKHNFTLGKNYEVIYIELSDRDTSQIRKFYIIDDNGKRRAYKPSNTMFQKVNTVSLLESCTIVELNVLKDTAIAMRDNMKYAKVMLDDNIPEYYKLDHLIGRINKQLMLNVCKFIK